MNLLINAAGEGVRFTQAGYTTPKPLLTLPDGRTILETILDSHFAPYNIVIALEAHRDLFIPVLNRFIQTNHALVDTIFVKPTNSPLESIMAARHFLKFLAGDPIIVNYCDTFLSDVAAFRFQSEVIGTLKKCGIVTFPSNDPRFGYWHDGRIYEKQVKGDRAVGGIFYFSQARQLIDHAINTAEPSAGAISLIHDDPFIFQAGHNELFDLGTPADYEAFINSATH